MSGIITIEEVYERRNRVMETGKQYPDLAKEISFTKNVERAVPGMLEKMVPGLVEYLVKQKEKGRYRDAIIECADEIEQIVIFKRAFENSPAFELTPLIEEAIAEFESIYNGAEEHWG